MITNFDKTPVYIFFSDLYKILKTLIVHITKLLLADYNIVEPKKTKSPFENNKLVPSDENMLNSTRSSTSNALPKSDNIGFDGISLRSASLYLLFQLIIFPD